MPLPFLCPSSAELGTYVTVYGMVRTTIYLPEELKEALTRAARAARCSEAELIREGVRQVLESLSPCRPRIPLFRSEDPGLAERADEYLKGFGQT